MKRRQTSGYRWLLPVWMWLFLVLVAAGISWIRVDADRDSGLTNVYTIGLVLLGGLVAGTWFVFFSRFPRKLRFLSLGGFVVAVAVFVALFDLESFSGSMIPRFSLEPPAAPDEPTVGVLPGDAAGIDLTSSTEDDFPGFLGPHRDLQVNHVRLAADWEANPPELLWRQPIGAGWSAFAIVNGNAVTAELRGDQELVTAYDVRTGELLWSQTLGGPFAHPLGGAGPRSTPLIDEGRVYALGANGVLVCLDGATGALLWRHDLLEEYGVSSSEEFRNVQYGRSNSPAVVGDLLVVPAGGNPDRPPVSLVAYEKRTGEKVWEGGQRQISFSSPRQAELAGVEQILIVNEDTASGHDPATGSMLWEFPWPGRTAGNATASQAVPVPPDKVFLSKGYGEGAALIRLLPGGDGSWKVEELWHNRQVLRTKLTNVIVRDGYVYGLSEGILECVDLGTGERVWKRGRYGHGQVLGVSDTMLVLSEDGEVVHVSPSPDRPDDVLGRFQALEGQTWNNLALYGALLVVRNAREAAVFRLPLAG